jgi:hypothetical protein
LWPTSSGKRHALHSASFIINLRNDVTGVKSVDEPRATESEEGFYSDSVPSVPFARAFASERLKLHEHEGVRRFTRNGFSLNYDA